MPFNMSFAETTPQVLDETKDLTRRNCWARLKSGQLFWAVKKTMGLRKGEKIQRLKLCRCISNRRERLDAITPNDVIREGFPEWTTEQFIEFYCAFNNKRRDCMVSRIEFEYVQQEKFRTPPSVYEYVLEDAAEMSA